MQLLTGIPRNTLCLLSEYAGGFQNNELWEHALLPKNLGHRLQAQFSPRFATTIAHCHNSCSTKWLALAVAACGSPDTIGYLLCLTIVHSLYHAAIWRARLFLPSVDNLCYTAWGHSWHCNYDNLWAQVHKETESALFRMIVDNELPLDMINWKLSIVPLSEPCDVVFLYWCKLAYYYFQ